MISHGFNFYAEYIMRNAGLDEAQAGIKIAGRNINNLRYADVKGLNPGLLHCGQILYHLGHQGSLTMMLGKSEGRGEGYDRGRDGWMALPTQWTQV